VPQDHPLRAVRRNGDRILPETTGSSIRPTPKTGRPSVAPERLGRALLLQSVPLIRSARMLTEQLDYTPLFRWFVGVESLGESGAQQPFERSFWACCRCAERIGLTLGDERHNSDAR
jgi:hypothetical protein